jgi:hypothetical protein
LGNKEASNKKLLMNVYPTQTPLMTQTEMRNISMEKREVRQESSAQENNTERRARSFIVVKIAIWHELIQPLPPFSFLCNYLFKFKNPCVFGILI